MRCLSLGEGGKNNLALWNKVGGHTDNRKHTHMQKKHTHQCRLMTNLHQLNECLLFSTDAAGHLLSLDIDLYFNGANTTENNKGITGWGHVSSRTFGVLLANPFIPVQGIHYTVRLINAKMSCMHMWTWKPFRGQDTDCVHMIVCVCVWVWGGSEWRWGGGQLFYFSFLTYQPWRASVVQ